MREFGIFSDEGCIERGIYGVPGGASAEEVGQARIADLRAAGEATPDEVLQVDELCPDHEEEPRDGCGECARGAEDEEL